MLLDVIGVLVPLGRRIFELAAGRSSKPSGGIGARRGGATGPPSNVERPPRPRLAQLSAVEHQRRLHDVLVGRLVPGDGARTRTNATKCRGATFANVAGTC